MSEREKTGPDVPRGEAGRWLPGTSPNPGGRPKKLVAIEKMLDEEFRSPESLREVFTKLRELALEGVTNDVYDKEGVQCGTKTTHHPAYMEMLLNRLMGPVKDLEIDLSGASDETLDYLRDVLHLKQ